MRLAVLGAFFILITSCKNTNKEALSDLQASNKIETVKNKNYELVKVADSKGTLVLFPGFGHFAKDTENEFKIIELATKKGVSVVLMNFNQSVFLKDNEKASLANEMVTIFETNQLSFENIYIGGFSSGGNVSLLVGNYFVESKSKIQPKGVFIGDSPVDLLKIYQNCEKNIAKNFSQETVEESKWIVGDFNTKLGSPKNGIQKYEQVSPFTYQTGNIENLSALKNTKIRLYTEPDVDWWKKDSDQSYEEMNAYSIEKLSQELKKQGFSNVELIQTKNKGYRANGERHPHSWSIIDKENLMEWMLQ
ncbi:hypothetical protein FEDK69T_25990 [Flavobacterium enshiense DK69]|uniref:Alpha/beta hydrolase n=1 Tax=Flavobacterium enshiense DK69 TaxID=1107311 RepID=V6S4Q5_9FLAO|nr:hypothetical protein [Flavobacterium enshiense]ESU21232.1 hypothetical protein FEDK69T_25990 [Flavobacterium enshiense DK69]KGO93516.1 hypothetical protein Q767_14855 [Flavobacterium enshiense DK69]